MDGIEITDISWTRGTFEPLETPLVVASRRAADRVVGDPVYCRSATGGGDAKLLRHEGIPAVEFGFGTQTAYGTDEYTTVTALTRHARSYAVLPFEFERQLGGTDG